MAIDRKDRPQKFCPTCKEVTPWNSHDRCLICQRMRSRADYQRRKSSGGAFSEAIKARLRSEHPESCPICKTPWHQVKRHKQHPNTPWHFDHHISPQLGGTNADENARIMCWPCNLRKLNKRSPIV
ncbi:HNH endonuclease [Bradyrhizobium sp. SZCCHNR2026]|uniref:HNH endonuclease n=1 Tax=Bradyrhizobium sp. SZCCHNR2026 TaxID=3057381 RepID=UPI0039677545